MCSVVCVSIGIYKTLSMFLVHVGGSPLHHSTRVCVLRCKPRNSAYLLHISVFIPGFYPHSRWPLDMAIIPLEKEKKVNIKFTNVYSQKQ